jgi:tripartite-type tricarboxylate transporter receptor subunit TctC
MLHVPFRGRRAGINDLVAGHVDTMFVTAVVGGQHMKTGALTPLALAPPRGFETLPEVPTMAEAGYPLEAAYWFGWRARRHPAGRPRETGSGALAEVLAMPDLRKRMTEMGAVVTPLGSRQFGDYIRAEMANGPTSSLKTASGLSKVLGVWTAKACAFAPIRLRLFTIWTPSGGLPLGVKWVDSRLCGG